MRRVLSGFAFVALAFLTEQAMKDDSPLLKRHYRAGEMLRYEMSARNQERSRTTAYQAQADGVVRKNSSGIFVVNFAWSRVSFNGSAFPLSPASLHFREELSLDPAFRLAVPDLRKVQPALIGPITDLLAFYADTQLAMRQGGLVHQGDHVYVKHGRPNSWADHVHTLLGEDAIDFDITLAEIDVPKGTATLVVKHVPPHAPAIKIPAAWMRAPVADTPNNWVQVMNEGGKYEASVGKEVFTDRIRLSLADGKILSAIMENPVEAMERDCSDEGLQKCGEARRYRIERHVEIRLATK